MTEEYSRRSFVKGLGAGAAYLAVAPSVSMLGGCSALPSSKQSYIHNVIKPQNKSSVFTWTDIMLQAVRNQSITPPPATRAFAMAHMAAVFFRFEHTVKKEIVLPVAKLK